MEGLKRYDYYEKRFSKKSRHKQEFLSQEEFHTALNLERLRSDRHEQEFSLVLFEIRRDDNPKMIRQCISIFHKRMRTLDVIGRFDDDFLGVLLPFADMKGAGKFTIEVEKEFPDHVSSPPYIIFVYPNHWFDSNKTGDKEHPQDRGESENKNVINIEQRKPFSSVSSDYEKKAGAIKERIRDAFTQKMPFWKRLIDIVISFTALFILSPILLFTALYIKLVSPGPVFFKQERIGYKGRYFTMFKFRTMKVNNNDTIHKEYAKQFIGGDQKLVKLDSKKDTRIIPGGRILRSACIDELPQLFNVLRGEMSVVGPRPPIPYEVEEYSTWHINRFDVVPGLTGLWQVSGKDKLTFNQMVRLDIQYRRKFSLLFDHYILFKTVPAIFTLFFEPVVNKVKNRRKKIHPLRTFKKKSLVLMISDFFNRIK
jgi:lipopolysaccharide/colanic/teichoic acid biosynthesis glycosyltransferase